MCVLYAMCAVCRGCGTCIRHLPLPPLLPSQRLGGAGVQPVSLGRKRRPWPWLYLGLVSEGLFWSLQVSREDGQAGKKSRTQARAWPLAVCRILPWAGRGQGRGGMGVPGMGENAGLEVEGVLEPEEGRGGEAGEAQS